MKKHWDLGNPFSAQRRLCDQSGRMPRLIWVFAGRTCHFVGFVMRRLIFLVQILCITLNCKHLTLKKVNVKCEANEPRHDKTNKMSVHPAKTQISLGIGPVWSVFPIRMKKAWVLSYPLSAQRRLWSDWADAQADLSLCWAHSHFVGFVMSWLKSIYSKMNYHNDPKFSDRQVWANSVDPDQTAPRGAVWSASTLFAILSTSFGNITLWWSLLVQILVWLQQYFGCPNF